MPQKEFNVICLFSSYISSCQRFPMLTRFVQTDDDSGDIQLHYGEKYRI